MNAGRVVVLLTLLLAACSGGSAAPTPTPPPSPSTSPSLAISPGEAATSTPPVSAVDPCTLRESLEGQTLGRSLSFSLSPSTKWQFCLGGAAMGSAEKYLFRTTDGGAAWTLISRTTLGNPSPEPGVGDLPNGNDPGQIFFLDATHGWRPACGRGCRPRFRDPGGVTWTVVPGGVGVSTLITSINFVDPMHGTVVTSGGLGGKEIVTWSTVDGGLTWTH